MKLAGTGYQATVRHINIRIHIMQITVLTSSYIIQTQVMSLASTQNTHCSISEYTKYLLYIYVVLSEEPVQDAVERGRLGFKRRDDR